MTPVEVGFLAGVVWSSVLVVWSLAEVTSGEPSPLLLLVAFVYEGFDLTPRGIIIGGFWAFFDGFVSGFVIWWIVCLF